MTVYYNLVDEDGDVIEGPVPYLDVLIKTGLKDQVGLTEHGWKEHHEPEVPMVHTEAQMEYHVRDRRNMFLEQSDWTQGEDSPLSDAKKTEWAAYRQELRDVPEDNDPLESDGFPDNVIWPTKPE